jgi:hypothetical protein
VVGIGWPELPRSPVGISRQELADVLRAAYPGASPNTIANYTGQIWNFVNAIALGDLVVVPLQASRSFRVGRVTGPAEHRGHLAEMAAVRPVEWEAAEIASHALAADLRSALGSIMTVFRPRAQAAERRLEMILKDGRDPGPGSSRDDRPGVRKARAEPARVFICYRREDAGYPAGWLCDLLAGRLGVGRVFKDVDSIEPGDDFAEVITEAVQSCAVLLAVIGGRWLAAAGQEGRRLDDPGDLVRLEIEAALARGVRVIPVLVDGAQMPRPDQLPASLAPLARRQAIALSHAHFSADAADLLNVLDRELRPALARKTASAAAPSARRLAEKAPEAANDSPAALPASLTCFRDDDAGFRRWREDNPDGFFLNTERNPGPGYLMLHRSGCPHFTHSPLHWTKDYIKFCASDQASLEDWASTLGEVKYCRTCFRKPAVGSKRDAIRG